MFRKTAVLVISLKVFFVTSYQNHWEKTRFYYIVKNEHFHKIDLQLCYVFGQLGQAKAWSF